MISNIMQSSGGKAEHDMPPAQAALPGMYFTKPDALYHALRDIDDAWLRMAELPAGSAFAVKQKRRGSHGQQGHTHSTPANVLRLVNTARQRTT